MTRTPPNGQTQVSCGDDADHLKGRRTEEWWERRVRHGEKGHGPDRSRAEGSQDRRVMERRIMDRWVTDRRVMDRMVMGRRAMVGGTWTEESWV